MVLKFQGRYESKVDTKGRWTPPSSLRLEGAPMVFTLSKDHGLTHLDVYESKQWADLVEQVSALAPFQPEVQAFKRFYLSSGISVEPDKLGRYLLPKALRAAADIENQVVVVGMGEKIEVWSKAHWDGAFEELSRNSESFMATLGQLSLDASKKKKSES